MSALDNLKQIEKSAKEAVRTADSVSAVQSLQSQYFGKDSELNKTLRTLKDLDEVERKNVGKEANKLKIELTETFEKRLSELKAKDFEQKTKNAHLDVTMPSLPSKEGVLHPITKEREKVEQIFQLMGFEVWEPNLIDNDYNNFTALNIPEGHPSRDMWDTIRINENLALIPHTSAMQNRIISTHKFPIRAIVPGKCFRNEATDARHEHSFNQVEGVYVDKGIKLTDMIGTIKEFLFNYFEREVPIKIQPTFFPFVEPGMEIMMECPVCGGKSKPGCSGCGGSGWMEIIPCGPIHPNVLKAADVDPDVYSGFAWGFGLDRLIMVKYGIDDIRYFHSGRLDFITQF